MAIITYSSFKKTIKRNLIVVFFWLLLLCIDGLLCYFLSSLIPGDLLTFTVSTLITGVIIFSVLAILRSADFLSSRQFFTNTAVLFILLAAQILAFLIAGNGSEFTFFTLFLVSAVVPLMIILAVIRLVRLPLYKSNTLLWPGEILIDLKWLFTIRTGGFFQRHHDKIPAFLLKKTHVSTSHFFRDYDAYSGKILNYYAGKKSPLTILSVGTARGQEAYSVSILCEENGIPVKILAYDISEEAINDAKNARYDLNYEMHRQSVDKVAAAAFRDMKKYFIFDGKSFSPVEKAKKNVEFFTADASTVDYQGEIDFVLARKMLYYLPAEAQQKAIAAFIRALRPGLDPAEHLLFCDFTYKFIPGLKKMISDIASRNQ